mmetsp:Transcript_1894/g.3089  ORF Transcript_1894/g.3089 Transcript_1894/m.3089 type:complete len:159 (-) Transcript_1894:143-619(-)
MLGKLLRILGRVLFAFLFVTSGLSKVQGLYDDSAKLVSMLQPRISQALVHAWGILHLDRERPVITPEFTTYVFYVTIFLELVGGVCFMIFPRAGSGLLAVYLVLSTPLMHDFYNHEPGSLGYTSEMVACLKNLALLGACLMVLGSSPTHAPRTKTKMM